MKLYNPITDKIHEMIIIPRKEVDPEKIFNFTIHKNGRITRIIKEDFIKESEMRI